MPISIFPTPGQTHTPNLSTLPPKNNFTPKKPIIFGSYQTTGGTFVISSAQTSKPAASESPKNTGTSFPATQFASMAIKNAAVQRENDKKSGLSLLAGATSYANSINQFTATIRQFGQIAERLTGDGAAAGTSTKAAEGSKTATFLESLYSNLTEGSIPQSLGAILPKNSGGALDAVGSLAELITSFGRSNPRDGAISGASFGAYLGSIVPGIGTLIGGAAGGIIGGALGFVKNGKHADQIARDQLRAFLQSQGFLDQNFSLQLADGSNFNLGLDGGHQFTSIDGSQRRAYETDTSNPLTAQVVGWVNPLAELLAGGDDKLRSDLAGYLTNAATSNASNLDSAWQNVISFYDKLGAPVEDFAAALEGLQQNNGISSEELAAYQNGLRTLVVFAEERQTTSTTNAAR